MTLKTLIPSDNTFQSHSEVLTLHCCDLAELSLGEMVVKTQSWI